jgi:hypothetical protein
MSVSTAVSSLVCGWLVKKEDIQLFDISEHSHLTDEDSPPNNILHKKVYRHMFLHINQGPSGAGIWIELPKCIEDGTRAMLPSPPPFLWDSREVGEIMCGTEC